MQFQDPQILASVRQMVQNFFGDSMWEEDLMQEAVVHLWRTGDKHGEQSLSWQVQRCRFLIRDWHKAGRSLDTPGRRYRGVTLSLDSDEHDLLNQPCLQRTHVFQEVSARDLFEVLWRNLRPGEQRVFELMVDLYSDTDIAERLGLERSTISRRRRRIAAVAEKLGLFR